MPPLRHHSYISIMPGHSWWCLDEQISQEWEVPFKKLALLKSKARSNPPQAWTELLAYAWCDGTLLSVPGFEGKRDPCLPPGRVAKFLTRTCLPQPLSFLLGLPSSTSDTQVPSCPHHPLLHRTGSDARHCVGIAYTLPGTYSHCKTTHIYVLIFCAFLKNDCIVKEFLASTNTWGILGTGEPKGEFCSPARALMI